MAQAATNRAELNAYLKRQLIVDRQVRSVLRATMKEIDKELLRLARVSGPGAQLRASQLRLTRAMLAGWAEIGTVIENGIKASAKDIAEVHKAFDSKFAKGLGLDLSDQGAKQLLAQAQQGMQQYISRKHFNHTLSDRVYRNGKAGVKAVERIIEQSLLSGKNAREIAKLVKGYMNPATPGGANYAAMRLARTEINNALHTTSQMMYAKDPFVEGVKWNLSNSHGKPDQCNDYANSVHVDGWAAGVYVAGDVPSKPHPQCLCYTTPQSIGEEDFLRQLRAGKFDHMAQEVA